MQKLPKCDFRSSALLVIIPARNQSFSREIRVCVFLLVYRQHSASISFCCRMKLRGLSECGLTDNFLWFMHGIVLVLSDKKGISGRQL